MNRVPVRRTSARSVASRSRGQALVELTVAMIALVPLLFAMSWLARIVDLRQATASAARQLAFECTVRADACADPAAHPELVAQARRRIFAAPRGAVRDDDRAEGPVAAPDRNPFWVARDGRSLLERFEDVTIDVVRQRFDTPLAFAGGQGEAAFPGAVRLLSELAGPGQFGLDLSDGLLQARVRVVVSRERSLDDWLRRLVGMPLAMESRLAVLTDAWTASGPYGPAPDSVETRVTAGMRLPLIEPVVDAGWLAARGLLATADAIGLEPRGGELRWHRIDVDRIPPDRLPGAVASPSDPPVLPPAPGSYDMP